ncbi:MAG TPA: signal peptidase II [Acidimicrobiales bacterium]|nr:signal peptidase II [Acidimicrobiales bacterium]
MQERGTAPALSGGSRRETGGVRRLVLAAAVAVVVVVVDQLTKSWAAHRLAHGDIHVVWKLDLELSYNSGASFGLARGWAPVIAGIAISAVVLLLSTVRRVRSDGLTIALGLVIGGALGNLTDRIAGNHHGAVVDFIALHFWPTFNVADSCIVIGAVTAALMVMGRDPVADDDGGDADEGGGSP